MGGSFDGGNWEGHDGDKPPFPDSGDGIVVTTCIVCVFFVFSKIGFLGGGFKDFLFSSLPGEMIQFD